MAPLGVVLHSETPALWKQSKFHPSYTVKSCLTPRQTTQPTKINKMQQNTKQANKWETKRLSLSCSTTGFFFLKCFSLLVSSSRWGLPLYLRLALKLLWSPGYPQTHDYSASVSHVPELETWNIVTSSDTVGFLHLKNHSIGSFGKRVG